MDNISSIEFKLTFIENGLLTPLNPSTATIQGRFTNVELTSDLIDIFTLTGNIIAASSNDGTVFNLNYVPPPVEEKKSKRGRKKKEKKKTKRCKNGKFGSMIQFEIKSVYKKAKLYKIKAFNKETFQVPGVLDPYFGDVMPALNELAIFLEKTLGSDKVEVVDIKPLMRNYTCRIINQNYRINLSAFAKFITNYQISELSKYEMLEKLRKRKAFRHNNLIQEIDKYLPINHMGIESIQFDLEKYAGIKIKFRRPLHKINKAKDYLKDITVKLYQSGKVNIDGGKNIAEIEEIYLWLNDIFVKNFGELIVDINGIIDDIDDYEMKDDDTDFGNNDLIKINTHTIKKIRSDENELYTNEVSDSDSADNDELDENYDEIEIND